MLFDRKDFPDNSHIQATVPEDETSSGAVASFCIIFSGLFLNIPKK